MGGCFVLGMMVGTRLPSSEVSQGAAPVISREKKAVSEPKLADVEQGFIAGDSQEEVSANEPSPFARKVARVISFNEHGSYLTVGPYVQDRISPTFLLMFDLTKDEVDRLESAASNASERYQEMQSRVAAGEMNADGSKLIVNVPPTPEAGGILYDDLLATFADVLGPDRFELFNVLSRQSFDQRYDRFGLNTVTYELDLTPIGGYTGQRDIYKLVHSYVAPDGQTKGHGTSQSNLKGLLQSHPLLTRFIPPELLK